MMTSGSNELPTEAGYQCHQNVHAAEANMFLPAESHFEHEQDEGRDEEAEEEEDVDFNPFLKETASLEASSSLSSEVEGFDADVVDSGDTREALVDNLSSKPPGGFQDYAVGDAEHGEEIVMQSIVSSGDACENEWERTSKKRKSVSISQPEDDTFHEKDNGSSGRTDADVLVGESSDSTHSRKSIIDLDDEDAICMRTRARYSLASFTLDELETFLQETDDDEPHNFDDEEEYRKFLAAVLHGGDGDDQAINESENVDDEDEDNDADFELEIEEALESDLDENTREEQEEEQEAASRRPETRQNRRQKVSLRHAKKHLGASNKPLRPLLPNAPILPFPTVDGRSLMPGANSHHFLAAGHNGSVDGFTPHQLGQLHCLIHEHVQLLIQVFSLCALEHSRQHIASQTREMISELLQKRDQVISWRRIPYPGFCFAPPYIHPSVPSGLSKSLTAQRDSSSGESESLCKGGSESLPYSQNVSCQILEGSFWVPNVNGTILSVLDVAPLSLVGNYMDDISIALQEHHRQYVEASTDTHLEREPLFPLHSKSSEANGEVSRGTATQAVPYSMANDQPAKKTLAAALCERTKKLSVAQVPKEIAKLAQRFFPLFNPALFPHRPPLAPTVNRALFTDAEDELLAMGLMEYNTDWKAIQQRFLPCKSKHQIFVRQKNRSSSKAPENPIKAVRRMKNSPLTAEEIARIQEGLKVFKLDWMSVWRFLVPYRDPSLLPRQWRVATGTQKSYTCNPEKREKRRMYAANRKKCRPAGLVSWQTSSEKDCQIDNAGGENNSGDDCVDNEKEAYVHEAFLSDWRPTTSSPISSEIPVSILGETNLSSNVLPSRYSESQPQIGHEVPATQKHSQNLHNPSRFTHTNPHSSFGPNRQISEVNWKSSKSQFSFQPFQAHNRGNSTRLVKLAPDLPPVNLPPSVRVMSQSAFTSYHGKANEIVVPRITQGAKSGTSKVGNAKCAITDLPSQQSGVGGNNCVAGGKGELDLQMHPLLFRTPEDGRLPYYPLNCSSSICTAFNFFGEKGTQFNLSPFHNPHQAINSVNRFRKSPKSKESTSSSCGIDFHPLLQRTDHTNSYSETTEHAQVQNPSDAVLTESRVNGSTKATCTEPFGSNGEGNELDLEIHLSSTNREENASGNRDGIGSKLGSGGHPVVMSSNNIAEAIGDQSLPEIVMEQEELSDSEEELGEHVEFECEEMADSEGDEGSDNEQIVDMPDKDSSQVASKKLMASTDFDDQQCEAIKLGIFQSNIRGLSEAGTLKSGLADHGKYSQGDFLCLSLNSRVPDRPSKGKAKTKHVEGKTSEVFVGKLSGLSRSSRSLKKTTPSTQNATSQAGDFREQLKLGSLAFNPSRKPRKHPTRTRSSLMTGRTDKSK